MAKETITDYETVEKEKEITVCDGPGCTHTDEDVEIVNVCVNPKVSVHNETRYELVDTFEDEGERREFIEKERKRQREHRGLDINTLTPGISKVFETEVNDVSSSAKIDLCQSCLVDFFDIDVEGDIEDIEISDGEINIQQIKENKYPTIDISNSGSLMIVDKVIISLLWPASLLVNSFIDFDRFPYKQMNEMDRSEIQNRYQSFIKEFNRMLLTGMTIYAAVLSFYFLYL